MIRLIEENKGDKNIYEYLNSKIPICEKDDKIFSNERLLIFFLKYKKPEGLIILYQHQFMIVKEFIEKIFKNILDNIHIIPYPIKYLCRIISEFIRQKFPSISIHDKNAFIGKFFFGKLLIPFLLDPITEYCLNENVYDSLKVICLILKKYISGEFFITDDSEFNYTPFNWLFINNIGIIFNIFKFLSKEELSPFIEMIVNNKLPSDYEYDFFKENPNEIVNISSIFYNTEQIWVLVKTIDENKDSIFIDGKNDKLKKSVEKLMLNNHQKLFLEILYTEKDIIKEEQNKKKADKKKNKELEQNNKPKIHYFLLSHIDLNPRYKEKFYNEYKNFFSIKKDKESIEKNIRIKAKNSLCNLLYKYQDLDKYDFTEGTTDNTENILNEICAIMKSSKLEMDDSIPLDWYIKSLLDYLKKIPKYLTKDDYEEFYNELEKDINKSIKELDFGDLSLIRGKIKTIQKKKISYQKYFVFLEDIQLNYQVKKIVKEYYIPVDIKFEYESEKGFFIIKESQFKEKDKDNEEKKVKYEKSNKTKLSLHIENFPKKFPNLVKYQEIQKADIFEIQKALKFPEQIAKYINIIRKNLIKHNLINLDKIMEKLYDYIMEKLYNKIFPKEPYEEDNKFFQKSVLLSWTQLMHFIKSEEEFDLGNFENDSLEYFKVLNKEKSPRKKIIAMNNIYKSIEFLLRLNVKDLEYTYPILTFSMIKAQDLRMGSNIRYMDLYIGEKIYEKEGTYLKNFKDIFDYILKIIHSDLNGVSESEFIKNCNDAKGLKI